MVLIIASQQDMHARCVAAEIQACGERVAIVDTRDLGNQDAIYFPINGKSPPYIELGSGTAIPLDEITTVWYRRPRRVEVSPTILDPIDRKFVEREWDQAVDGLLLSLNARFVNPLPAQWCAVKPLQLNIAHSVGLAIPKTLITNNPAQARQFISQHNGNIIHKVMTPHPQRFLETRRFTAQDLQALACLPLAPVMFQEEVTGSADVRATIIGRKIFAARILTPEGQVDSRLSLDTPYETHVLPERIHDKILRFMDALGLVFGTIDLKMTYNGGYVFLEVNPQGQFLYIEIWTGLPIVSAMAKYLIEADL